VSTDSRKQVAASYRFMSQSLDWGIQFGRPARRDFQPVLYRQVESVGHFCVKGLSGMPGVDFLRGHLNVHRKPSVDLNPHITLVHRRQPV
jgi:hypothetical protein